MDFDFLFLKVKIQFLIKKKEFKKFECKKIILHKFSSKKKKFLFFLKLQKKETANIAKYKKKI